MTSTEIVVEYGENKPYDKQLPLLTHEGTVVCEGATKTGKTVIAARWQLERFMRYPAGCTLPNGRQADGRQAWYGPTYRVAKISHERMEKILQPAIDAKIIVSVSTPYPKITGIGPLSGREWHFLSTQKLDLIYGEQWDSIVIEEFTRHRPTAIDAIRTTAHPKRAPMRLIGNLRDKVNDGFKLARQVQEGKGMAGWLHLDLNCYDARDAGLVTDAELLDIKADYARRGVPHLFARDWENRFDDAGQPFPSALVAAASRKVLVPPNASRGLLLDAGGKENPGAIVDVRVWHESGATRAHIVSATHYVGDLPGFERAVRTAADAEPTQAITFDSYAPMLGDIIVASYPDAAQKVSSRPDVLQTSFELVHGMMDAGTLTMDPTFCTVLVTDLDHVVHRDEGLAFAIYEGECSDGRLHQIHADAANALLQGFATAMKTLASAPVASHVRVHGTPLHRQTPQTAVRTGRDWR
jgi:hypothetical protein